MSAAEWVQLRGGRFDGEWREVPREIGGLTLPHHADQPPFSEPFERYMRREDGDFHHISVPFSVAQRIYERDA